MMYWGNGFGLFGMLFGGLLMLLFWGVIIALAVFAIRALVRSSSNRTTTTTGPAATATSEDRALSVLKERYAKGEITKDEYETIRRDLAS